MPDDQPFRGFSPEALAFLADLKANNNRDWFNARKDLYKQEVQAPFHALLRTFTARAADEGLGLVGDPKTSPFRIYRDTRFSKDKTPYKPHASAFLTHNGHKKEQVGLYLHIQPGNCFLAAGTYMPPPPVLKQVREAVVEAGQDFVDLADRMDAGGLTIDPVETTARIPPAFKHAADNPAADFLRYKSFMVRRPYSEIACLEGDVIDEMLAMARDSRPLLDFLERAMGIGSAAPT